MNLTRIQIAIGAMALLSFQSFASVAHADTCTVTEYPCTETFIADPTVAQDPPLLVPDPGDDPGTPPIIPDTESGGGGESSGGGEGNSEPD
jgi:hypothetical protein